MTEIPEHLLKRSKERRAAIGGEEAPAEEAAPATEEAASTTPAAPAAPAVPAPAAPAEVAPPAPEPVRPEVAAARGRKKIPFWALPVLIGLPLWAYVYQGTLEPPPAADDDPVALGEAVYSSKACATCHGADGGGASGPALTGVLETWPDYRDHMTWVRLGSNGWPGDTYGANDTPKQSGMPPHPQLSDEELAEVVLYERIAFGGLEEGSEEFLELEAIAHGDETVAAGGLGDESAEAGVDESALEGG